MRDLQTWNPSLPIFKKSYITKKKGKYFCDVWADMKLHAISVWLCFDVEPTGWTFSLLLAIFPNSHLKITKALNPATFEPPMLWWWFRFSFGNAERSYFSRRKMRLSIFPVGLHRTHIFVSVLVVIHITNAFVHFSLSATIAQVIN